MGLSPLGGIIGFVTVFVVWYFGFKFLSHIFEKPNTNDFTGFENVAFYVVALAGPLAGFFLGAFIN
jgi:hypothetical protein